LQKLYIKNSTKRSRKNSTRKAFISSLFYPFKKV
jgi:hypothetical protein